jgi:adenylylsulfate kinase
MDSHTRSLAKAISYRLLGSLATAFIFFALTGKPALSIGAGALDMVVKLALYFVHERIWNHIGFGRAKPPEYEI